MKPLVKQSEYRILSEFLKLILPTTLHSRTHFQNVPFIVSLGTIHLVVTETAFSPVPLLL